MAYTRHGHHIGGSRVELPYKGVRARCGGVQICQVCKQDASAFHNHPSNTNFRKKEA